MNHRQDIDGLRALAVIPVIFFHAGVPGFTGGYIGVDIFFVISGFLITSILQREIAESRFSIFRFYERRIRRIFPALFTVLIVTSLVTMILALPRELDNFGKSLFASALFYANYFFMFDTGYFSAPAESKPLLHMWSLAVEEQFYIFFPLILFVVSKLGSVFRFRALAIFSLACFGYSEFLVQNLPNDAFYSTPARAWELLLGSLLATSTSKIREKNELTEILGFVGIALILGTVILYSETTSFPGASALVPCVGTALLIYSGSRSTIVSKALSIRPIRGIGLISYSLYLWHWPILVFVRIVHPEEMGALGSGVILLLIFSLSVISWRYVEEPFRQKRILATGRPLAATASVVLVGAAAIGALFALGDGFPGRLDERARSYLASTEDLLDLHNCDGPDVSADPGSHACKIGADVDGTAVSFVVWGDSHGQAMLPAIDDSAKVNGATGIYYGRPGCVPLLGVRQTRQGYDDCDNYANGLLDYLTSNSEIETVILIARWALYANGTRYRRELGTPVYIVDDVSNEISYEENRRAFFRGYRSTIEAIAALGKKTVLVSQVPENEWHVPNTLARLRLLNQTRDIRVGWHHYVDRQAFIMDLFLDDVDTGAVKLVRPELAICDDNTCSVMKNHQVIYRDSNHITRTYATTLAPLFAQHTLRSIANSP